VTGGVVGVAGTAGGVALPPKILNMTVPHVGHLPLMALRPFFITSSTPSTISFLALHLTQYPSAIKLFTVQASCPNGETSLTNPKWQSNLEKEALKPIKFQ
jgi:hypothetical protein